MDLDVEVAVIGGGVMGVTAGYLLKRAGRRVAVIERGRCGMGETGRSAAHLTAVTDTRLTDLVEQLGPECARAVWHAGFAALARIRANVRDERINCGFAWVPGYLWAASFGYSTAQAAASALRREVDAAGDLGIDAAFVEALPVLDRPAVLFENQARLDPVAYLQVLASRIPGDGSFLVEGAEVTSVEDRPLTVWAGHRRIRADFVVIATHLPLPTALGPERASWFETNAFPYRTYAVSGTAAPGRLPEGLFWENVNAPYEYLRVDRRAGDDDLVVLGGHDHWAGQVESAGGRFRALSRRLEALVPDVRITHRWAGEVIETRDGLPFIGEAGPNRFVGTGFGGNGLTFGTLAGMMAVDAALGRTTAWTDIFSTDRSVAAARPRTAAASGAPGEDEARREARPAGASGIAEVEADLSRGSRRLQAQA